MPERDKAARFRKEKKEDAVQHGQGVVEEHVRRESSARLRRERGDDGLKRLEHTISEGTADLHAVPRGQRRPRDRAAARGDASASARARLHNTD